MAPEAISVFIADDHQIVRDGLKLILETAPNIVVVGEADDGANAVAKIRDLQPDVVLMDLRMPRMDGMAAIKLLVRDLPSVAIVILTTYDDEKTIQEGLRAGAKGYLLKDTDREALFGVIRAAAAGDMLVSAKVADAMLRANPRGPSGRGVVGSMTARELEVLEAVASDLTLRQIAKDLQISERTVKAHLASIYAKLDVTTRSGAVAKALRDGILRD